jgi:hypothetical protein
LKRGSSKEKPIYAFIRKGNSLVPELQYDLAALEGIANGQRVRVEIKAWRNLGRLRAYWATLSDVIDATECAANVRALHEAIKLGVGIVERIQLEGHEITVPGSIDFERMDEAEMIAFFQAAERWLAEKVGYAQEVA